MSTALSVKIAAAALIALPLAAFAFASAQGGSLLGNVASAGYGYGQDKVAICHKPGTPAEKTLSVPAPALGGHIGHGDTLGPCENGAGVRGGGRGR